MTARAATRQKGWQLSVKKVLDRTAAAAGLSVLWPLIGASAVGVLLSSGRPVLFKQIRPGHLGKPFTVLKFRTMRAAFDADGKLLPDGERLTSFGRFLRRTSLDELPQLWNVLRGEVSLVGPRPLLMSYLSRYSAEQARRHNVLPGITGWAQVNGRNAIDWPRKLALDVWYVDNWSLALDAKILALTVARVLKREGITREGHATMPDFMGNEHSA
jgi:lipopolysaccharide/colanic/teichoic acid biosynthesis glycosyltransferase